jgi:imidazolonepropionase-like amidohydrolase
MVKGMDRYFSRLILAILSSVIALPLYADTLIHAGRLIDGFADEVVTNRTIRVADDTITAIENGFTPPGSNDTVVDLRNATVLPGLMDMHVHITSEYAAGDQVNDFTLDSADYAYK